MTLIVQDDTGTVVSANGYIDAAFFKLFHADRGNTFSSTTSEIEKAVVRATDYLDARFKYVGSRKNSSQATEWPRYNALDRDDYYITGVPNEVKESTADYARISLDQTLFVTPEQTTTGAEVKRLKEKIDGAVEVETEYFGSSSGSGSGVSLPEYPIADRRLRARGLIRGRNKVSRG